MAPARAWSGCGCANLIGLVCAIPGLPVQGNALVVRQAHHEDEMVLPNLIPTAPKDLIPSVPRDLIPTAPKDLILSLSKDEVRAHQIKPSHKAPP
jgi:hypothetical protein